MNIYTDIESMPFINQAVVTVGTFDGVHLGHRSILEEVDQLAKNIKGTSVVISFDSHPRKLIDPDFTLKTLTSTKEKNNLLQKIGIDTLIYVRFTPTVAQTVYSEFIKFLTEKIEIKKIVVGYDHSLGKNREGNIDNLKKLIPLYGFEIVEIPQQSIDKVTISSSAIRKAIYRGDISLANKLLGYPYTIETKIESNTKDHILVKLMDSERIFPPNGIYNVLIDDTNIHEREKLIIQFLNKNL